MRVTTLLTLTLFTCATAGLTACDNSDAGAGGGSSLNGATDDASTSGDIAPGQDGTAVDSLEADASGLTDTVVLEDTVADAATDDAAPTDGFPHKDGKGGKFDGFGGFDGKGPPDGFGGFDGTGFPGGDGFGGGDAKGPAQTPCTSAADCTGKCGKNATAGCTCAANAQGTLTCHPACATDADCPTIKLPNGYTFKCTNGACLAGP